MGLRCRCEEMLLTLFINDLFKSAWIHPHEEANLRSLLVYATNALLNPGISPGNIL